MGGPTRAACLDAVARKYRGNLLDNKEGINAHGLVTSVHVRELYYFVMLRTLTTSCGFEDVLGFDVVLFSVGPLLVMLFGVVLLADGGGVIVLFTGELVFELLKGGVLDD